jgi:hypothetical protein
LAIIGKTILVGISFTTNIGMGGRAQTKIRAIQPVNQIVDAFITWFGKI